MYIQELENIRRNKPLVLMLDTWLSNLHPYYAKRINPSYFSSNTGIELKETIKLFNAAVKVGVLDVQYKVFDEEHNHLENFSSIHDVREKIYSGLQDKFVTIYPSNVEVWYKLKINPKTPPPITSRISETPTSLDSFTTNKKDTFANACDMLSKEFDML